MRDLLEHQHQHLTMVSTPSAYQVSVLIRQVTGVLDTTADLIDNVISAAQTHLASEVAAAAHTKRLADQAASTEISRLRAQNVLLAKLLTDEKAKTAHLRTELVSNLTNLIVGFTDAQDASWSGVMAKVQAENEEGVRQMGAFSGAMEESHAEGSRRARAFSGELEQSQRAGMGQREAGRKAVREVKEGMRVRLEEYGERTRGEMERQVEVVDGFCGRLGETSADGELPSEPRETFS